MTAPILRWYDGDDLIEAPSGLAVAVPGTPSVASEFDFWNDKDGAGADTAYDRVLELKARVPLTAAEILAGTPPRPYVSVGHEVVDEYWFSIQQVSGLGDLTLAAGAYQVLGAGRRFRVPTLASECGVRVGLRVEAPAGAQSTSIEWSLSWSRQTSRPLPIGLHESVGPGVALGIGDGEATWLLAVSANVAENGGGVDQQVQMGYTAWVAAGVPYAKEAHLLTISEFDSAAAALIAGERYKNLIYAKSDGTIAEEKSVKTAGTPTDPTLPAGGLALARVVREFDGLVNTADITNLYVVGAAHFTSSGLTGSIGPYRIENDNRLAETSTATTVSLTDAATNRVWSLPDGALSVTITAAVPESRALLLWEAVTAGGVVTSSTDRRLFYAHGYRMQRLEFSFEGTLAAAQKRRAGFHFNRPGYIVPIGGIALHLLDSGTVAGATTFDINLRAPGGALTTIFTDQAGRPSIAAASATLQHASAYPVVLAVPAYSLFEAECDSVPDTTTPAGSFLSILIACP